MGNPHSKPDHDKLGQNKKSKKDKKRKKDSKSTNDIPEAPSANITSHNPNVGAAEASFSHSGEQAASIQDVGTEGEDKSDAQSQQESPAEVNLIDLRDMVPMHPRHRHSRPKSAAPSKSRESILESVDEDEVTIPLKSYADIQKAIVSNAPIDGYDRYRAGGSMPALIPTHNNLSLARNSSTSSHSPLSTASCILPVQEGSTVRPHPRSGSYTPSRIANRWEQERPRTINSVFPTQAHNTHEWSQLTSSTPDIFGSLPQEGSSSDLSAVLHASMVSLSNLSDRMNSLTASVDTLYKKQEETEAMVIQMSASRNNIPPTS